MTIVALAPVSWLDGVVTAQRLMVVIYGTMVVAGIGALTRLLFDRRTAIVATAFAGLYGGLWLNDVMVMSETFAALAVVGLLFAAYWYRRHPGWGSATLFGVMTCLAGYARAELLVLGGTIGIFAMWLNRDPTRTRDGPDGIPRRVGFGHLAAAGLVAVVLLAPWVIRNQVVFEEPVLISTQDGGTLLGANCPATYNGRFVGFWLLECVSVVPRLAHEDSSEAEAKYREKAVAFIGTHAAELPRVAAFRVGRGLGLYRPDDMTIINQLEGRNRVASWISTIQFWVLGVLAFVGLTWWPTRDRWRVPRWPVIATVVFTVLTMAISYGNPRFRIPLEPGLVVAAAVGAIALADRFRVGSGGWRAPLGDEEPTEPRRFEQGLGFADPAAHLHRFEAGPGSLFGPHPLAFGDEVVDAPPLEELGLGANAVRLGQLVERHIDRDVLRPGRHEVVLAALVAPIRP